MGVPCITPCRIAIFSVSVCKLNNLFCLFECVGLHDAGEDLGRDEDEIYAFWHTRNQTKVDVFVKSTCSTLLSIYVFHTNAGMEQLRLA